MKIRLNDMVFYGYHGVHPEERTLGQRFIVNVEIATDSSADQNIRDLEDTIDYTAVYALIKEIMETQKFHLLEVCANTIIDTLLESFDSLQQIKVSIVKPSVPINGHLASVEVEMERNR
ncbi:MAG: dihydroneopterin aldolase [Candidatus Cloacimonetes bacterium]|nr:dihydroneopterin aldolase [Candidatus Cloacimonadota bacterium]